MTTGCLYPHYNKLFCLYLGVIGDQAADMRGWQHTSCGDAGGTYDSGDGGGLPSDLAAICWHGPRCHHGLQFIY